MTWLNSDDMLAPGALHIVALTYLKKPDDLIAGICLVHENNRITSIIKPQAIPKDFTPEKLAQIGKFWSGGHYFRQPEVIFTRKIWQKTGSALNEQLQYAMDYEIWFKMAQNQVKLTIIDYPLAFFRTHKQQKTADYQFNTACILEQIAVRNKFYLPTITKPQKTAILTKINQFIKKENKKILVIAHQQNISQFNKNNSYITYCDHPHNIENFNSYDAIILLVLLKNELNIIEYLKKHNYDKLLIGWFWYNNCQYYDNAIIAEKVDICIPANQFLADILVNESSLVTDALPIACLQSNIPNYQTLKVSQKEGFYIELPQYINYQTKQLINIIKQTFPDSKIITNDATISESEKLQQRLSYPVALCLSMAHEIPPTLLTTLLCEQIPIITGDVWELDRLIPQKWLFPVINVSDFDPLYIKQVYQEVTLATHTKEILSRLKTTILTDNLLPKSIDQILTLCYHLSTKEGSA
jgi:hypothetical protein